MTFKRLLLGDYYINGRNNFMASSYFRIDFVPV